MIRDRFRYDASQCSAQRTLEIIGDKWSMLVLREAFLGITRFSEFQRALGCARNILSTRLTRLVENGILELRPYQAEGERRRDGYHLTAKGRDLFGVVLGLLQWGDRYLAADGAPLEVRHSGCRAQLRSQIFCTDGHGPLGATDAYIRAGPGAKKLA
jgi:DNA-binding HxlR family transcriptional regulator